MDWNGQRITVVADDKKVLVNGEPRNCPLASFDPEIWAIQWYGDWGEIEYRPNLRERTQRPPDRIDSMDAFHSCLAEWEAAAPPVGPNLTKMADLGQAVTNSINRLQRVVDDPEVPASLRALHAAELSLSKQALRDAGITDVPA